MRPVGGPQTLYHCELRQCYVAALQREMDRQSGHMALLIGMLTLDVGQCWTERLRVCRRSDENLLEKAVDFAP